MRRKVSGRTLQLEGADSDAMFASDGGGATTTPLKRRRLERSGRCVTVPSFVRTVLSYTESDHLCSTTSSIATSDGSLLPAMLLTDSTTGFQSRFNEIASMLLRNYRLSIVTGDKTKACYEFMEVEFYLYQPGCHEDPFTHRSHEQQTAGQWYAWHASVCSFFDSTPGTSIVRLGGRGANRPHSLKAAATVVGHVKALT